MRLGITRRALLWTLLLTAALCADAARVKVIFDTDYMTDCDDPGSLALLHALADNGEVEILATVVSGRFAWSAPAVDVVNTYYGRGDLPVAALMGAGVTIPSGYALHLAQNFPHTLASGSAAPDATEVYREILAGQPDRSVVVVTVGYATNLRDLLASEPDLHSPLTGSALVAAKVLKWVNMGGNFEPRPGVDTSNVNWTRDTPAAVTAIRAWPTEIVFNGREIGHSMRAGARLARTPAANPVRAAYQSYFGGTAQDRHCADLSATLYAVRGLGHGADRYWALESGQIAVNDNASFTWTPGARGARAESRMLDAVNRPSGGLLAPGRVQEIIEDLMIQAPLGPVATPPTAPTNGAAAVSASVPGQVVLTWSACTVPHPASWVAGYRVRRGSTLVGTALGPRFVDQVPAGGDITYSVAAFTPSGVEGPRLTVQVGRQSEGKKGGRRTP